MAQPDLDNRHNRTYPTQCPLVAIGPPLYALGSWLDWHGRLLGLCGIVTPPTSGSLPLAANFIGMGHTLCPT